MNSAIDSVSLIGEAELQWTISKNVAFVENEASERAVVFPLNGIQEHNVQPLVLVDSAYAVWKALRHGTLQKITAQVAEIYDVLPEEIISSVKDLLISLESRGVVHTAPQSVDAGGHDAQ